MNGSGTRLLVSLLVAVLVVAGITAVVLHNRKPATSSTDTSLTTNKISIQSFAFVPGITRVKVGTTVTWTNLDSTQHTVTMDSGSGPDSPTLNQGQSYSYTFTTAGSYAYHCSFHPYMTGTVVVQ